MTYKSLFLMRVVGWNILLRHMWQSTFQPPLTELLSGWTHNDSSLRCCSFQSAQWCHPPWL